MQTLRYLRDSFFVQRWVKLLENYTNIVYIRHQSLIIPGVAQAAAINIFNEDNNLLV